MIKYKKQINKIFESSGLEIFDKTPKLGREREKEISAWLYGKADIEAFAVLDDAFLSADFMRDNFVRTSNFRNGLDEEAAVKTINILNVEIHRLPHGFL